MKSITWFGALIALLGLCGMAIPVFAASQTHEVASVGDVKIQSTEQSTHVVPTALSVSGLALVLVFIGVGVFA
jgi:hypothetical protein